MTLSTFQKKLDSLGFETVLAGNILQASLAYGEDFAVEITIDSGGGAKVVKRRRENKENKSFGFKGKKIPIVCEKQTIETFRLQLDSPDDLELLEKKLTEE